MLAMVLAVLFGIVGIFALYLIAIYTVGEVGGEVAILRRPNVDGSTSRRRVWIVDSGDLTWVAHGGANAWWVAHLENDPSISVERGGEMISYRAVADPDAQSRYRELIREKYGWASVVTDFLMRGPMNQSENTPVRLERT